MAESCFGKRAVHPLHQLGVVVRELVEPLRDFVQLRVSGLNDVRGHAATPGTLLPPTNLAQADVASFLARLFFQDRAISAAWARK